VKFEIDKSIYLQIRRSGIHVQSKNVVSDCDIDEVFDIALNGSDWYCRLSGAILSRIERLVDVIRNGKSVFHICPFHSLGCKPRLLAWYSNLFQREMPPFGELLQRIGDSSAQEHRTCQEEKKGHVERMSKPSKSTKGGGHARSDIVLRERDQASRAHISRPRSDMLAAPRRCSNDAGTRHLGSNNVTTLAISYQSQFARLGPEGVTSIGVCRLGARWQYQEIE
jgi:hypothetical protein